MGSWVEVKIDLVLINIHFVIVASRACVFVYVIVK